MLQMNPKIVLLNCQATSCACDLCWISEIARSNNLATLDLTSPERYIFGNGTIKKINFFA